MSEVNKINDTGRIFYVSNHGSDNNDGLSPDSAWKTYYHVTAEAEELSFGDTVLFERDGIYRGGFKLVSGITYGAYGEGYKPRLYGSLQNYAEESMWEATTFEHVWQLQVGPMSDVGNIVFNHGEAWGMKRIELVLSSDFEFYHDKDRQLLFLFLSSGNPGAVYNDIEVCSNEHIMRGPQQYMHDIVIDNLCIKYTGAHGITFRHGSNNIVVRNCEIGYIGGSMMDATVRYGNGFEVVDGCSNILVENNWVYQCYDAGITHQSSYQPGCIQENIIFRDNIIECCNYNIEYYVSQENGIIKDTVYENNILRNAGHGFGSVNRIGSDTSELAHICCYTRNMPCENFVIQNNVLDTSTRYLTTIGCSNVESGMGPIIRGNSYIQRINEVVVTEIARIWDDDEKKKKPITASNQAQMKEAIRKIDTSPKEIVFKTKDE